MTNGIPAHRQSIAWEVNRRTDGIQILVILVGALGLCKQEIEIELDSIAGGVEDRKVYGCFEQRARNC